MAQQEQDETDLLTVNTDESSYDAGDDIIVSGTVPRIIEGEPLLFRLYDPLGGLARTDLIAVFDNGTYRYKFPVAGPMMVEPGQYKVVVNYNKQEVVTFYDFSGDGNDCWWQVHVDGQLYLIRCQISGGSIQNISADRETKSVAVTISTRGDQGVLKIELMRALIQAQDETSGQDVPYSVFIDGTLANFTDITFSQSSRALEIPFTAGANEILIIGTWMVPEFLGHGTLIFGVTTFLIIIFVHGRSSLSM